MHGPGATVRETDAPPSPPHDGPPSALGSCVGVIVEIPFRELLGGHAHQPFDVHLYSRRSCLLSTPAGIGLVNQARRRAGGLGPERESSDGQLLCLQFCRLRELLG